MKPLLTLFVLLLLTFDAIAQDEDSLVMLGEVTVRAFEQNRKPASTTSNVRVLTAERNNKTSLVNAFNTIAGVRMEERSPGSYRVNIRGSSLRSPFGVRNVKVYWNGLAVTDPGGNTYFNQFAVNNFSKIEVFKGPAGSLYGAGTGGLILMNSLDRWRPGLSFEYTAGSYGLQSVLASASFGKDQNRNRITFAHNESDGYRVQSAMRRDNFSWTSNINVSEKHQLAASFLFTDMFYQTPGALNLGEYNSNPRQARPAAGGFPGAAAINAAIYQKNVLAGFSNEYLFGPSFKNVTSLYGAFAQIKNSAIRNYERRVEPHFGGRSVFVLRPGNRENLQLVAGAEFQQGFFNVRVSQNRNGNPDTLQANDDINYGSYSLFAQGDLHLEDRLFATLGVSINRNHVATTRLSIYPARKQELRYQSEFAPRLSVLYKFSDVFSLLGTASAGFSPPSTVELLPSTGIVNPDLEAERGSNFEMTGRLNLRRARLYFEATAFYFKIFDALVQLRDLSGADYFTNAGEVKQKGMEFHGAYTCSPAGNIIDHFTVQADYTYSHFRYGDYRKDTFDYSGKKVPSVPPHSYSLTADLNFQQGIYVSLTYYAASRIFLNDANSAFADPYHLAGARIGWKKIFTGKFRMNLYLGADNLFDQTYSLGNDINAPAGRFYNAAPPRNYYAGIGLTWAKPDP